MGKRITDKVTWVGKIDWELKRFHGDEYSTDKGSSYNAYLIRDEKTVLLSSPTINYGFTHATAGTLEMMKGLKFRNKKAAAFGSSGSD